MRKWNAENVNEYDISGILFNIGWIYKSMYLIELLITINGKASEQRMQPPKIEILKNIIIEIYLTLFY